MATERYRRNSIASLKLNDGSIISDHDQIAGCFWAAFKYKMGTSLGINMAFDLQSLIQKVDGLDVLTQPFSKSEMDKTVQKMLTNKAP